MVKSGDKRSLTIPFMGRYTTKLSPKGRTALPVKFRQALGPKAIITQGQTGFLIVVSTPVWKKSANDLITDSFDFSPLHATARHVLGSAFQIEFDDQGRFIIPAYLRHYAQLKDQALFLGVGNRIEVWDESTYLSQTSSFTNYS